MAEEIRTSSHRATLGEDGIVRLYPDPGVEEHLAEAKENVAALAKLAGGRRVPLLVYTRNAKSVDREARGHVIRGEHDYEWGSFA